MAITTSQSQMPILDDNSVSRLMAQKAMLDCVFKEQLSRFLKPTHTRTRVKDAQAVISAIAGFRVDIVNQAGLKAPNSRTGNPREVNSYLRHTKESRFLLANVQQETTGAACKEETYEWGWVGSPTCVAHLAFDLLQSTLRFQADATPFPFDRLPPEIRLQVYREVLGGMMHDRRAKGKVITVTRNRHKKFQFQIKAHCRIDPKEVSVSLLAANRLVNSEALPVLYQQHTFDFTTSVENVAPVLSNLPEGARQYLHGIAMELHNKGEAANCCNGSWKWRGKGRDNQVAWSKSCGYIARNVNARQLSLWLTINVKVPAEFETLTWVIALVEIKGLRQVTLIADQHNSWHQVTKRASYKGSSVSAADHCFSEHLVALFHYLCQQMLE